MDKQIISKMQIFMLSIMTSCGFVITILSYEHFSGNSYPLILLCAFLIAAAAIFLLMPLYFKGGLLNSSGGFGDKLVSAVVAVFLLAIIIVSFYSSLDFWMIYDYRKNIPLVFVVLISLLVYLCSRFGIEVIARLALWFFVCIAAVFVINSILLQPKAEISRIFPLEFAFNTDSIEHILFTAALYLPPLLIALIYSDSIKHRLNRFNIILPVILGMFIILIVVLRTILVLGSANELYTYALIQSLKLIQFPGGLAGVELFDIIIIMSTSLFYLILLNCCTARLLRYIFPELNNDISCLFPIAAAAIAYGFINKYSTEILQPYFSSVVIISAALTVVSLFCKNISIRKQEKTLQR